MTGPNHKKQTAKSKSESTDSISSTTTPANKNSDEDKLNEAIRDLKVAQILKLNEIFENLRKEYEDHIPIYVNRIQFLDQKLSALQNDPEKKNAYLDEILNLSKFALEKINQNDLLRYYGEKNHDPASDDSKK
jgi:hypothetical protein